MDEIPPGPVRTRVKICGITRPEDALAAVRWGADALGLNFYAASPRVVDPAVARAIAALMPPFVSLVGLFVNPSAEEVAEVLSVVPLDLLQFHGTETPEQCRVPGRRYIKAVAMRDDVDLAAVVASYTDAAGLLVDTYKPDVPGGTGQTFDWTRIPPALAGRLTVAGGLNPTNVAAAIRSLRPYAVDVSSGVERAPGIKDEHKIAAFMQGVRHAQADES